MSYASRTDHSPRGCTLEITAIGTDTIGLEKRVRVISATGSLCTHPSTSPDRKGHHAMSMMQDPEIMLNQVDRFETQHSHVEVVVSPSVDSVAPVLGSLLVQRELDQLDPTLHDATVAAEIDVAATQLQPQLVS